MSRIGRVDEALEEIHRRCGASAIEQEQWLSELQALATEDVSQIIIEVCVQYGVTPEELLGELAQAEAEL